MLYIKIIQNRVLLYRDYRFTVWEQSMASPRGKSKGALYWLDGLGEEGGRAGRAARPPPMVHAAVAMVNPDMVQQDRIMIMARSVVQSLPECLLFWAAHHRGFPPHRRGGLL